MVRAYARAEGASDLEREVDDRCTRGKQGEEKVEEALNAEGSTKKNQGNLIRQEADLTDNQRGSQEAPRSER